MRRAGGGMPAMLAIWRKLPIMPWPKQEVRVRVILLMLALLVAAVAMLPQMPANAQQSEAAPAALTVFWSSDCPVCLRQKPFLDGLESRYPGLTVRSYELTDDPQAVARFMAMAQARGVEARYVPTLFFAERVWVGDSPEIRAEIEAAIAQGSGFDMPDAPQGRNLPFGLDEATASNLALTVAIGFIDGLNPCSLWVLTLLLGLVVNTRSRKRIILVGVSFLTVTALVYGGFIAGVFGILHVIAHLDWIRWLVAALAAIFGVISLKDYITGFRGFSLSIPESRKPAIYRDLRRLASRPMDNAVTGGLALVATSMAMAAGIAIVELPCTAGFPVLWSAILTERGVSGAVFGGLLALYLALYLAVELSIFAVAVITLRMGRLGQEGGGVLRLYGGAIMLALAGALLFAPGLMQDLRGTLLLFLGAVIAASAALLIRRIAGVAGP